MGLEDYAIRPFLNRPRSDTSIAVLIDAGSIPTIGEAAEYHFSGTLAVFLSRRCPAAYIAGYKLQLWRIPGIGIGQQIGRARRPSLDLRRSSICIYPEAPRFVTRYMNRVCPDRMRAPDRVPEHTRFRSRYNPSRGSPFQRQSRQPVERSGQRGQALQTRNDARAWRVSRHHPAFPGR